jgi:hypothetical protein
MIPCIENKCIAYPTCQNKRDIDCPDIGAYYNKMRNDLSRDDTWNLIKETLHEMRTFRTGKNGTEDYIYLEEVPYLDSDNRVFGQEPL